MNIYFVGVIIIFALFVIILIVNPNISCFGRKIKSPFYPLLRKRTKKSSKEKKKKIDDYGFTLVDEKERRKPRITELESRKKRKVKKEPKVEDYGFSLSHEKKRKNKERKNKG